MEKTKKTKTSRVSQTRVKEERPKVWTPPSTLDAPPAPDGYVHRLIRAEVMGYQDTGNMAAQIKSGWELVRADEYSEYDYPQIADGKYAGMIGVGGLVLARMPEELAKSRDEYYRKMNTDRNEALQNDVMKEQHPSMPINQDRQTRVTFGGTKKN